MMNLDQFSKAYLSKRVGSKGQIWYGWQVMPPIKMIAILQRMRDKTTSPNMKRNISDVLDQLHSKVFE